MARPAPLQQNSRTIEKAEESEGEACKLQCGIRPVLLTSQGYGSTSVEELDRRTAGRLHPGAMAAGPKKHGATASHFPASGL